MGREVPPGDSGKLGLPLILWHGVGLWGCFSGMEHGVDRHCPRDSVL